jgi:hypothetical protein
MKKSTALCKTINQLKIVLPICILFTVMLSCTKDEVVQNEPEALTAPKESLTKKVITTGITVTDNGNDGNVAANAIDTDSDYATSRWASNGTGKYITIDLGKSYTIDNVAIMWYQATARKAYFKIQAGTSTSSLATVYDASTTGSDGKSTTQTYSFTKVSARYVRIYCNGNSLSTWNSIIDAKVNEATTTTTTYYPTAVLGITSSTWKINSHTGSPSSSTYWDDITDSGANYSTYNDPNYFYSDGTWTIFKCWRGAGTSSSSSNPRVELREMISGTEASWNGSSGTHSMTFTVKVDKLPKGEDGTSGVLCFGQIHGPSTNASGVEVDDIIRVQFYGLANQSTGAVKLKISGYITETVLGGSKTIDGYALATQYTFTIKYTASTVYLYNGSTLIFSQKMNTSCEGNYFKTGNYLQSVKGLSYDGSYGLVSLKGLSVTHN